MKERAYNILLLMVCTMFFLLHGKANKKGREGNILVVAVGKLGDVVCTTPVLSALKKGRPRTRVYLEDSRGVNKGILADSDLVDGYMSFRNIRQTAQYIKEHNITTVCFTGPHFKFLAYAYLARVPLIVTPHVQRGFCPQETKTYRVLRRYVRTVPFYFYAYAPKERLRVLEPMGVVSKDTDKTLGFSSKGESAAGKIFEEHGIDHSKDFVVGVTLSAGNKIKMWDIKKFAQVITHLQEVYHARVVLIGGEEDVALSDRLRSVQQNISVIDTVGTLSLDELKALISKLHLFVGVDTGPIYIAEAFGVPTIDIVGPVDEREQPPIGKFHRVVVPRRKEPALYVMNARIYDKQEAVRQAQATTAEDVIKVIDDLIPIIRA